MTPLDRHPRGSRRGGGRRVLIPLSLIVLGIALGVGGVLLRPFRGLPALTPASSNSQGTPGGAGSAGGARTASGGQASGRLSDKQVYARIAPSVVDVTSTLRYQDETASGTGFLIDARRDLVLTNNHVIRGATAVLVTVPATGRSYPARVVGVDVPDDVAVLKLAGSLGLPAAPTGDSARLAPGAPVLAIGNQAGAGGAPSIAPGVVSATGRTILADDGGSRFTETLHGMLQVTARIQPGDSGGPLADTAGQVIGMDTAAGTGHAAAGYAIPINVALRAARLITAGRTGPGIVLGTSGFLGVVVPSTTASSPRAQAEEEHGLGTHAAASRSIPGCLSTEAGAVVPAVIAPAPSGALVDGVLCGTAAASAGIAAGDVIIAADGRAVTSPDALTALVNDRRPGTVVAVTWVAAAGATRTTLVRLDTAPAA